MLSLLLVVFGVSSKQRVAFPNECFPVVNKYSRISLYRNQMDKDLFPLLTMCPQLTE